MKKLKLKNILNESAFKVDKNPKPRIGEIQTDKDFPPFAVNEEEWLKKWGLTEETWTKKDWMAKYHNIGIGIKNFYKNVPEDNADDIGYDVYKKFGELAVEIANKYKLSIDSIVINLKK
jgi:hypothetical protein